MSPQILNVLSYFMGLALVFQLGFFAGGIYQRYIIANAYGSALQGVENLFTNVFNLFKRGTNEKAQNSSYGDIASHLHDVGVRGLVQAQEQERNAGHGKNLTASGLGNGEGAYYQGASQQGGEGFSGKACPEEGDCDRAGTVDH